MPIIKCQCGTGCGKELSIDTITRDVVKVSVKKKDNLVISMGVSNREVYRFITELIDLLRGEEFAASEERRWKNGGHNQATDKD